MPMCYLWSFTERKSYQKLKAMNREPGPPCDTIGQRFPRLLKMIANIEKSLP